MAELKSAREESLGRRALRVGEAECLPRDEDVCRRLAGRRERVGPHHALAARQEEQRRQAERQTGRRAVGAVLFLVLRVFVFLIPPAGPGSRRRAPLAQPPARGAPSAEAGPPTAGRSQRSH